MKNYSGASESLILMQEIQRRFKEESEIMEILSSILLNGYEINETKDCIDLFNMMSFPKHYEEELVKKIIKTLLGWKDDFNDQKIKFSVMGSALMFDNSKSSCHVLTGIATIKNINGDL